VEKPDLRGRRFVSDGGARLHTEYDFKQPDHTLVATVDDDLA